MLTLWMATARAAEPPPAPPPAPVIEVVGQTQQGRVKLVFPGREGDKLWVDGWEWGVLPTETELAEGEHEFRVDGPKGEKVTVKLIVPASSANLVTVDLSKPTAAPVITPLAPPPAEPAKN